MARRRGSVEYTGPFFEKDPSKTLRQNMKRAVAEMTEAGGSMLRSQFTPGRGSEIGSMVDAHVKEVRPGGGSIFGVVRSRMSDSPSTSYVTWMERGRRRQRGGGATVQSPTFKGTRSFSRVRTALRRQAKVTAAELIKGVY